MKTLNEQLWDKLTEHQTHVLRYGAGLVKLGAEPLFATESDIRSVIAKYVIKFDGVGPATKKGQQLLKSMIKELTDLRREAWLASIATLDKEYKKFVKVDQSLQIQAFDSVIPLATGLAPVETAVLTAIASSTPFDGATPREWMTRAKNKDLAEITRRAKISMVNGHTLNETVANIIGSPKYKYKDGVSRKVYNDIESTVLTVVSGISNSVWSEVSKQNADIISFEVFSAVLDGNTTHECAGYDRERYPVGVGPIPPLHMRCRSKRLPVVTEEAFNMRGFDPTYEKGLVSEYAKANNLGTISSKKNLPYGHKTAYNKWAQKRTRELVGTVPAKTSFETWMRGQRKGFQDSYFGKRKAEIFRQGRIPLSKFTTRDGRELTIGQLENLIS